MSVRLLIVGVFIWGTLACGGTVTDGPPPPAPDPYDNACPKKGGEMVEVPDNHGGSYCIDATEVTNAAYGTWLDTTPSFDLMPDHCRHRNDAPVSLLDYRPQDLFSGLNTALKWPLDSSFDPYPVVWVSWCDAAAFCNGQGKRLCGAIGGGPLQPLRSDPGFIDPADPKRSEFMNAVTRGGTQTHVYGEAEETGACWPVAGTNDATVHAVETKPECEGGYDGLFDLEGNAEEFVNACVLHQLDETDMGPSCVSLADSINGDHWVEYYQSDEAVGFRCCADVPIKK